MAVQIVFVEKLDSSLALKLHFSLRKEKIHVILFAAYLESHDIWVLSYLRAYKPKHFGSTYTRVKIEKPIFCAV
jgi:hypothetical protein